MKLRITLLLFFVASLLKAQESTIIFYAPEGTPANADVSMLVWSAELINNGTNTKGWNIYPDNLYPMENLGGGVYSVILASEIFRPDVAWGNWVGLRFLLNGDQNNPAMYVEFEDQGMKEYDAWPTLTDTYDDGGNLVGEGELYGKIFEATKARYWKNQLQAYDVVYNVKLPSNTPDDRVVYIWGANFGYGFGNHNRMVKQADGSYSLTASYFDQPTLFYTYILNYEEIMEGDVPIAERNADEEDNSAVDRIVPDGPMVLQDVVLRWEGMAYVPQGIKNVNLDELGVCIEGNKIIVNNQEAVSVTVYNFLGQTIKSAVNQTIELPEGNYIIKVSGVNKTTTQKIIISL